MKPSSSNGDKVVVSGHDSSPDRLFNNPIYGCSEEEPENIYANPDTNHHPGTGNRIESSSQYPKFDNAIYGLGQSINVALQSEEENIAIEQESHISSPVQYMKPSSSDGDSCYIVVSSHDSSPDGLLNNPIYGCSEEELENIYANAATNHQLRTGTGIESSHKFDNPIYGFDEDENAYSTISTVKSKTSLENGAQALETEQV